MPKTSVSTVLTIRVPPDVERRLAREARRLRQTRSEVARSILDAGLPGAPQSDPVAEARRQSTLASAHAAEREALQFLADFTDLRGWE